MSNSNGEWNFSSSAKIFRCSILPVLLFVLLSGCAARNLLGPTVDKNGVTFRVKAPSAKQVSIVGNFNRWSADGQPLSGPDHDGIWAVTLPLKKGRHEYLFLIDGKEWLLDPNAPMTADDGFGAQNSVLYLQE